MGSRVRRLWSLGVSGCRAQAHQLWRTGLVAWLCVGSSRTRDWTRVSCTRRWILYHRATRKVLMYVLILVTAYCLPPVLEWETCRRRNVLVWRLWATLRDSKVPSVNIQHWANPSQSNHKYCLFCVPDFLFTVSPRQPQQAPWANSPSIPLNLHAQHVKKNLTCLRCSVNIWNKRRHWQARYDVSFSIKGLHGNSAIHFPLILWRNLSYLTRNHYFN